MDTNLREGGQLDTTNSQQCSPEVEKKMGSMRAHVKASVQAALFSCLMAVNSTNAMSETPSHEGEELAPVNAEEVYIVGGGKAQIFKDENGKYVLNAQDSENGSDTFHALFIEKGEDGMDHVYNVIGNGDESELEVIERPEGLQGKIMDYSPYGEMALNFLTGEAEFLEQVELKLEGKKPKFIPRIRDAMYAQWSEGIDFLYKMGPEDTEIHNSYVNLFQEMAPNMVATWKGLPGAYDGIAVIGEGEAEIAKLKASTAELKANTAELKAEIAESKSYIVKTKANIAKTRSEIEKLDIENEKLRIINDKMNQIANAFNQ